jgi:integrase
VGQLGATLWGNWKFWNIFNRSCPLTLTDVKIRNAAPGEKPMKLFDGQGLYLEVAPSGGKWWRMKYRFGGKEKRISLGVYPARTLAAARNRRDEVRKQLANGIDPSENRKAEKLARVDRAASTFEAVAREYLAKHSPNLAPGHVKRKLKLFVKDIFPWLGKRPVADVTAGEILATVRRIEGRGALDTAHRALANCSQVFRYAVSTRRRADDPASLLRGALPPVKGSNFAAVTDPNAVAEILRAMDGYEGTFPVRCALRLAPLVFVRPGELRKAQWSDIDLDSGEWRFRATKTDTDIIVPLSRQAVEILRELQPLTGKLRYVFPSPKSISRPMSDNAVLSALRRMGIPKEEMCGHGFRAMARTILDEVLAVRVDLIEHQLGHVVRDALGTAYNRTSFLPERRAMMQRWSDYLDELKGGTRKPIASEQREVQTLDFHRERLKGFRKA